MNYMFPFEMISTGSKVVIYGAGEVGCDFFRQIKTSQYCEVAAWVDKQFEWYCYIGLPVQSPEKIKTLEADAVVVAVANPKIFAEIKKSLIESGIAEDKIIWKDRYNFVDISVVKLDEKKKTDMLKNAVQCRPAALVNDRRMDIVVRYIYGKEILNKIEDGIGCCMYEKLVAAIGGREPVSNKSFSFFSDYEEKKGIEEFKKKYCSLLESMQSSGFKEECFIPLDKWGEPVNGAHRIAAAMVLGFSVLTVVFDLFDGFSFDFSLEWLKKNGFTNDECECIEKTYSAIKV